MHKINKTNINNKKNNEDLFKMATIGINAGLETLGEVVDDLDQIGQGDFFPRFLQKAVATSGKSSQQRAGTVEALLLCFRVQLLSLLVERLQTKVFTKNFPCLPGINPELL